MVDTVREITIDEARNRLLLLGNLLHSDFADSCIYVVGNTYAKKSNLLTLADACNFDVVLFRKIGPMKLALLPIPRPNYFVIKFYSSERLINTFELLLDYLIFEVVVFETKFETDFLLEVKNADDISDWTVIKSDPSCFIYSVNTDDSISSTGIMEKTKLGSYPPLEFLKFAKP